MSPRPDAHVDIRTDRVGVLIDQLVDSKELAAARIDGLTADEHLWEPYPNMWFVRRRNEARTLDAFGPGEWVIDRDMYAAHSRVSAKGG